jgi:AcrR family transcriptional regulator
VLHHFGSREALVEAVVTRALDGLQADVMNVLATAPEGGGQVAALLDGVFAALTARGHGRALMWLALAGNGPQEGDLRIREVAETVHALRQERFPDRVDAPTFEDSQFTVVLAASVMIAHSVVGSHLLHGAGVDDARAPARFRAWLAQLLVAHLSHDGQESRTTATLSP